MHNLFALMAICLVDVKHFKSRKNQSNKHITKYKCTFRMNLKLGMETNEKERERERYKK